MNKIMFNDHFGLTEAVLKGRKTMTRRLIKQEVNIARHFNPRLFPEGYDPMAFYRDYRGMCRLIDTNGDYIMPTYMIGEVVALAQSYNDVLEHFSDEQWRLDYMRRVEDAYEKLWDDVRGINNKMFVKSELMLYQIRITDIKIERLQDISDEDCLKEGIMIDGNRLAVDDNIYVFDVYGKYKNRWYFPTPKDAFAYLIDKVSGKGTWERNPWVFAYSFKLVK